MWQRQKGAKASKERSIRKLIELAIVVVSFNITSKDKKYEKSSWRREALKVDCMSDVMGYGIYREELGGKLLHDRERMKIKLELVAI